MERCIAIAAAETGNTGDALAAAGFTYCEFR